MNKLNKCWLDKDYVAEQMKKDVLFACSNSYKQKHGEKSLRMALRTACLRELTLGEDGLLHCPVHGLEISG